MKTNTSTTWSRLAVVVLAFGCAPFARAQTPTVVPDAAEVVEVLEDPPEDADEAGPLQAAIEKLVGCGFSRVRVRGHAQAGLTLNPDRPNDRQNFGRLFDDRANDWRLNQLLLTVEQQIDPDRCVDWGFKAQLLLGTDARFIHPTGTLEDVTNTAIQAGVVEANATVRFRAGIDWDLKLGVFPSLCGLETIDATGNVLYSHSYVFNFGVPLEHLGALLYANVGDGWQVAFGIDRGTNVGFSDVNQAPGFQAAVIGKLFDDALSFTLASHYGPDDDSVYDAVPGVDPDEDARFFLDLAMSWAVSDRWKLMADLNYGRDAAPLGIGGTTPEWYGVAGYVVFKATKSVDLVFRGEVFRDDDGFAVIQAAENDDYLDLLRGRLGGLDPRTVGGGATTYHALTLGANWRPCDDVLLQGEVRYDWADGSMRPFDDSSDSDQLTLALSAILSF